MTDRQGVEIDYCAKCRGVWLDRGELQKLIDLSIAQLPSAPLKPAERVVGRYEPSVVPVDQGRHHSVPNSYTESETRYDHDRYIPSRHDNYYGHHKPKKRESWFSELFDFD
jgi:uncharacterized protein